MRSRSLAALPVAVAALALLAGCTWSVGANTAPTRPADEIETRAADELEASVGLRPVIECGDDDIPVKANTSITCVLVDPTAGLEYDVVITFAEVNQTPDGLEYTVDLQVADAPNNAPQPTAEPGASVDVEQIEALAVAELRTRLGYVPEVACEGDTVDVVVGATVDCSYTSPDGPVDAVVTITAYDATTGKYDIRVD